MKAIIHLEIFVHGEHVANLHVTRMWTNGNVFDIGDRYLKFRDWINNQILTIDTRDKRIWFRDSVNRIHRDGVTIK